MLAEVFLIDGPPPTISGSLHMGHAMSYSHMDFVARYRLACGNHVLYPFCYDSNGLPTERLALKHGCSGNMEIARFADNWAMEQYAPVFRALGMAYDYERRYSTFAAMSVELVHESFTDLQAKGLLYKAERPYFWCPKTQTSVSQSEIDDHGCYERSGEKVEERIGEGYFINMKDHLPELRKAVNAIQWHPDHFRERLLAWMDGIEYDWSISRERNFGIPIPGEQGLVFDTWFTSSLSPQLSWLSHTGEPSLQCPIFDVRFQAHDIIRTWALFTITKSLYHNDHIPWHHIVVSGHAVDNKGRKFSKTLGNYKELDYYLEHYGQAGVRYWASLNSGGAETRLDEQAMLQGKKLVNKIRNAKRYVDIQESVGRNERWVHEWATTRSVILGHLDDYQWWHAMHKLREFFWGTLCDQWIEENKHTPATDSLRDILGEVIGLFAVFLPNIQETV